MKGLNLSLGQRMKVAKALDDYVEPDGPDHVRYVRGLNEQQVAEEISKTVGFAITSRNVRGIRKELHGNMRVGGSGVMVGRQEIEGLRDVIASLTKRVVALEERVSELEKTRTRREVEAGATLRAYLGQHQRKLSSVKTEMRSRGYTDEEVESALSIVRAVIRGTGPDATVEAPGPRPVRA